MAFNPGNQKPSLSNPNLRQNDVNDADFLNQQGYYPYDLTHQEFLSPRFGEVTPSMHLITAPGDRFVVHDNTKTILSQIDGNLLSTVNQYVDSYYVPLRSLYPVNYEKFIPNPTKGDDLPNSALPRVPLGAMIADFLFSDRNYTLIERRQSEDNYTELPINVWSNFSEVVTRFNEDPESTITTTDIGFAIGRMLLLSTVLSRGQLLDYLGLGLDTTIMRDNFSNVDDLRQTLQYEIDEFQRAVWNLQLPLWKSAEPQLTDDSAIIPLLGTRTSFATSVSEFRSFLADCFEKGKIPVPVNLDMEESSYFSRMQTAYTNLYITLRRMFELYVITDHTNHIQTINTTANPFDEALCINQQSILAYQQVIAQYFTNDSVDNIFTSDLFMQNLRSVMFPSMNDLSIEPTFDYNGVNTEYDLISYGAFYHSLISPVRDGHHSRQMIYMTIMYLMRRSLRYGDYFSGARPNMLAVGQLSIDTSSGSVSPIDITQNLLKQRYLNAANYQGSGFLQQFAGQHGVVPSDTGTFPRFVAHRKIELQNKLTNNTAQDQGKQTTNLAGYSDDIAFDVFIDDFGVLLSLVSYDVLPVYTSGIDNTLRLTDRFDYFNPMLQNIGDQAIYQSEIFGDPGAMQSQFGFTMRNAEYKYKLSKAHGAFVNGQRGFLLPFPIEAFNVDGQSHISPDFIRDKPKYLDRIVEKMTGVSPGEYFHFLVACTNQINAARKIQETPPILF